MYMYIGNTGIPVRNSLSDTCKYRHILIKTGIPIKTHTHTHTQATHPLLKLHLRYPFMPPSTSSHTQRTQENTREHKHTHTSTHSLTHSSI